MKVLVIGSGGREDALVWKIGQSELVSQIWCAPGNDGIAQRPKTNCLPLLKASGRAADNWALANCARENEVLTVVGSDAPLASGIVDIFTAHRLTILDPTK